MRFKTSLVSSLVVSGLVLGAAPALAADEPPDRGSGELPPDLVAAMQRDLGLSKDQAQQAGVKQEAAIALDRSLQDKLGSSFAGSEFDARTGKLRVMVSDAKQAAKARAAGAEVQVVKRSRARLDAIKGQLDAAAGVTASGVSADRSRAGNRQASMSGVTSWFVDESTNTVHVTVAKAKRKSAALSLAKYGDAVSIEASDLDPQAVANFMDGGDAINGATCSAGFNLRNPSTGQGYLLTAGHCVSAGSTLTGQGGVAFGPVLESWFPGWDDALARNDNPGYWNQGPWVDYNPSNGGVITVSGYTDAPVNTLICKSGITTKWTCGYIRGKDETVTYSGGRVVPGLTRHDACVEPGDSGGSNVSVTTKYSAEGVTSGASMIWDGSRYRCRSTFGQQNVSWYYPIADSLAYYGPKYGITTW